MEKIFYHVADLDGICSGAVAARKYPNAILVPYNYYYDFDRSFGDVAKDEPIMFVDITPRKESLLKLMMITKNLTIVDHHSDSLKVLSDLGLSFPGIVETGNDDTSEGACVLTWKYCFPEKPIPRSVKLIGDYDVWRHNDEVKAFHYGLGTLKLSPVSKHWDRILNDDESIITGILNRGHDILNYIVDFYALLARSYAIPGTLKVAGYDSFKSILINQGCVTSEVFDSIKEIYDLYFRVTIGKDGKFHCSVTTPRDDINCGALAGVIGDGGGRQRTAGFAVESLSQFFAPNDERVSLTKVFHHESS